MTDKIETIAAGELQCFPEGAPADGLFAYLPGTPRIEFDRDSPKAYLMTYAAGGQLSLQAVWQADATSVATAQAVLARLYPDVEIQLKPAPLEEVVATLHVIDADGTEHVVGPRAASGDSANRIVFSEPLRPSHAQAARDALNGQPGRLRLHYEGMLSLHESSRVEISGDLAPVVRSLAPKPAEPPRFGLFRPSKQPNPSPPPSLDACKAALQGAFADGHLHLAVNATAHATASLIEQVRAELLSELAQMLFEKVRQLGANAHYLSSSPVHLACSKPESRLIPLSVDADLGQTLAGQSPSPPTR